MFRWFWLIVLLISGCATVNNVPRDRVDFDIADGATLWLDSQVLRGDIQVVVHPNRNLETPPTALFMPLGLTQDMRQANEVSQGVSRLVWQKLLEEKSFSVLEMADMRPPYRVDMALPLAKAMGAQFLVGGYITYLYDGGSVADSRLSLQLSIYDVATGNLIWSLAHAGVLPYKTTQDFIVMKVKRRMPYDPMTVLTGAVAGDMAELIHYWTDPASMPKSEPKSSGSAFGR